MARAQSELLHIYDLAGVTHQRWQSYYANTTVTWNNSNWVYVPFVADGFTAGIGGDETNITITAPATSTVITAFEQAIRNGRFVDISIYEFDTEYGNTTPQAAQILVGSATGQVVGGSSTLTRMSLQLGSALSPVGAQIPPRTYTTSIMGKGCRL